MKKLLPILMVLVLVGLAADAQAVIGWAGNAWPNHGANVTPVANVTVYSQVWKGGVTDQPGQGLDIAATLFYQTDLMGSQASVAMVYNADVGNNDEYKGDIPQAALAGATYVDVTVIFDDLTDGTSMEILADQAGNVPPLRYNVIDVLPNDVAVTFQLCMSGEPVVSGNPCVIGSAAELGSWANGVSMTQISGDLYEVTVVFLAGDNPFFEYKYKNNGCVDWESVANRTVTLPTDGTTAVSLPMDSWNNLPIGCGQGQTLNQDTEICFQVCVDLAISPGGACVTGNGSVLGNWSQPGISMDPLGGGLFQACVIYPAGTPIPFVQEFKFQNQDCNNWETIANRSVTIDNSLLPTQTLTFTWDDGQGFCAPVSTNGYSWGLLKSQY